MNGVSGASRTATFALAGLLAGSVCWTALACAESAGQPNAPASRPIVNAAAEPAGTLGTPPSAIRGQGAETGRAAESIVKSEGEKASEQAAEKAPLEGPSAAPAKEGAPPVTDFKEAPKEEPAAIAAPALVQPTDPLGAAMFTKLAETKLLLPRLPASERDSMRAFYAHGEFKPVWIKDGALTPAARSVIERLNLAAEDALDPKAYPVPALGRAASEAEIADAEVRLSSAALLYARDARGGRLNLARLSALITPKLDLPTASALLPQLAQAGAGAGDALQGYNPRTEGYLALKARLTPVAPPVPVAKASVETTASTADPEQRMGLRVPLGPVLKVGMSDPRVPMLRKYLGLPERPAATLDAGPGEPTDYDQAVSDAVAAFQRGRALPANGNLTRGTIVALAIPDQSAPRVLDEEPARPEPATGRPASDTDLVINMERWRWLPGDLGSDYVLVNIPEFRLRIVRDGVIRDETRVIVGKTESPTPLFSGMMEYAVVNPSWYVPPSILKTMRGTGGFEVIGKGKNIGLRQPPGPRNALGYIKFLFPNQHAVYLHDTPNRGLFSASRRAMSHGCVRVDDPFRFADAVLKDWTAERLKKLIGRGERTIHLPEKLPVHLAYFTAYVDDHGVYRTQPDLYGYDGRMRAALGLPGGGARVANVPVEPKRQAASLEGLGTARAPQPAQRPATPRIAPRPDAAPALAPRPAVQRPIRQEASREPIRQPARRPAPEGFGEPGLWTPEPPRSRGWW